MGASAAGLPAPALLHGPALYRPCANFCFGVWKTASRSQYRRWACFAAAGPGTNGKEAVSEDMRARLRAAEEEAAALQEQLAVARQQAAQSPLVRASYSMVGQAMRRP